MNLPRWERLWALSGALFVVLFFVGLLFGDVLATRPFPPINASPVVVQSYFLQNATEVQALSFFHVLSAIALLCFVAYLAARVRRVASNGRELADIALAGGVTAAAFFLLSAVCYRMLAEPTVATDPALAHALLVLSYLAGGPLISVPLALPIGISAFGTVRQQISLPRWTGWLGLAAMVTALGSASYLLGPANNGSALYGLLLLGGVLSLLWVFIASVAFSTSG